MKEYKVNVYEERTEWYDSEDELHREDGPAVTYLNGYKAWYKHGKFHREDGPAIEYASGDKSWYLNGKLLTEEEFNEKRWVVDVDTKDENYLLRVMSHINESCRPIGVKILKVIPTKSGYHLITERFDVMEFKKRFHEVDIQKKNPMIDEREMKGE